MLVKSCLEEEEQDPIIEELYYEVTLMRDYFAGCKKRSGFEAEEFNRSLLHFCLDFLPCGKERAEKCIVIQECVMSFLFGKNDLFRKNKEIILNYSPNSI